MRVMQTQKPNANGTQEFYADTFTSIDELPKNVTVGSTCLICDTGDVYIVSPNGNWVKLL